MSETEQLLVALVSIFVLGIGAQWLAWRLRLPSILVLLFFGFAAGPLTGFLDPDALLGDLLFPLVSLSVALVLAEGGLSLRVSELGEIGGALRNLMTIGVLVTWVLTTVAAYVLLEFSFSTALLLGATLVVTGPTVIVPLLRNVRPVGRVAAIARWEGIIIDPVGAVLAVLVFEASQSVESSGFGEAAQQALVGLLRTAFIGGCIGTAAGLLLLWLLRRYWIPDFLQSPAFLMAVVAAFTGSNLLQDESGLLSVTLLGVVLANQKSVPVRHIIEFKESIRVVLVSTLFILLAARVGGAEFGLLGWRGLGFVAFLVLIVRPASVLLSTVKSTLSWQERAFLSWLAPRGIVAAAVASVFALRIGEAGEGLVQAAFLVIVGTVTVYGLTTGLLARRLGLATPDPQGVVIAGAHAGARAIAVALQKAGFAVRLVDSNRANISVARMEGLPTHYASILSEHTLEKIDLGGIGRFLALTPNDEVNSLAALHFRELFGRAEVYQLPPEGGSGARTETATRLLRGRFLFGPEVTYRYLDRRFAEGAVVKQTVLTDEFDFDAFRSRYGDEALPLFLVDESEELTVCTADADRIPRVGQILISLVDPIDEPSGEREELPEETSL